MYEMNTSNIAALPSFILEYEDKLKGARVNLKPRVGRKLYIFIPSDALWISIGIVIHLSLTCDKRSYFVETTRTKGLNLSQRKGHLFVRLK